MADAVQPVNRSLRLSRRGLLAGGFATCASGLATSKLGAAAPGDISLPSLKRAANEKGIVTGSAYFGGRGQALEELLSYHCNIVTPEAALKAAHIAPDGPSVRHPEEMDAIERFCRRSGLKIHGHALFWHESLPTWLSSTNWADLVRAYRSHMRYLAGRYPSIISWDVINEPISDSAPGYRQQPVLQKFGDDFLTFLFKEARRSAPDAKLVLNDYNLSCGADFCERKRDAMLHTLSRLLKRGAPIDVLGIQAHIIPKWPVVSKALTSFVSAVKDLGLEIYISELDVNDIGLEDDVGERDQQIAKVYGDYLEVMLSQRAVTKLGFWGLSDQYHWIVEGYAPLRRKTGMPRPALFDQELNPKPAFFAVLDAINAAPVR